MFRAHFGGPFGGAGFRPAGPRQQGGAQAQAANPVLQLLHLLPVLALLLFTLLSSPGQPVRAGVFYFVARHPDSYFWVLQECSGELLLAACAGAAAPCLQCVADGLD